MSYANNSVRSFAYACLAQFIPTFVYSRGHIYIAKTTDAQYLHLHPHKYT